MPWDQRAALGVPFLMSLGLVIVAVLPVPLPFYGVVAPSFSLIAVFFWTVFRPGLLAYSGVFVVGLLQDILLGVPLGTFTLALLTTRAIVLNRRLILATRSKSVLWFGFSLTAVAAVTISWALISIFSGRGMPLNLVAAAILLPVAIFPIAAWGLAKIDAVIPVLD